MGKQDGVEPRLNHDFWFDIMLNVVLYLNVRWIAVVSKNL